MLYAMCRCCQHWSTVEPCHDGMFSTCCVLILNHYRIIRNFIALIITVLVSINKLPKFIKWVIEMYFSFKGHSMSLELTHFNRAYVMSYFVITVALSCSICKLHGDIG